MSKFWQKKYISKYTGAEIDAAVEKTGDLSKVEANPTLAGTEAALTGLEVGDTKYKVEQPINVVANPTLAGTEAALEGLQVGDTKYKAGAPDFIVNITVTEDGGSLIPSLDKTYEQIVAAITDNYNIKINVTVTIFGTAFTMTTRDYGYSAAAGGITGNFMLYFMGNLNYYALQITSLSATFTHESITLES